MEIIGIGIDICKNFRIEKIINKFNDRFLTKVFHSNEIDGCNQRYSNKQMMVNFFAKRFAGKEAFVKALGFGFNGMIKKNEIAILNDEVLKKPCIKVFGETKKYIENKFGKNLKYFISLSDEDEYSVANVLITRD